MPPRLAATQSRLGDILIYDRADQADADPQPIVLHLDTTRRNFAIQQRWLPVTPGEPGGVELREWTWTNGPEGAGTAIETQESYAGGASNYGEFAWLRRIGIAQPAGKLTELTLPTRTAAATAGNFVQGQVFGASNDLWITTAGTTTVKVPGGTGTVDLTEDFAGASAATTGIAVFNGTGSYRLYVANQTGGIREYNGTSWTEGDPATTTAGWLASVYWVLGDKLATGGAASSAGGSGPRLVVTAPGSATFRHVAGDPKVGANYSAAATVGLGEGFYRIAASNRVVWFAGPFGVYGVDGLGYSPNLLKAAEIFGGGHTGNVVAYWAGMIWFGTPQGLLAFRPDGSRVDVPQFVQFGSKRGVTPIYGLPTYLAPSEDGLYVAYHNADTGTSYVGVLLLDNGAFRWSMAETVIEDEFVTYVQQVVGSDDRPRLFIGTVHNTARTLHLYVQDLPISGDPETDYKHGGSFVPATAWKLHLSRTDGTRAVRNTMRRYMLEADQLGQAYPDNAVAFQIAKDGGAAATQGTARSGAVRYGRWSAQPQVGTTQVTSFAVTLDVTSTADDPVFIRTAGVLYSAHPDLSRVVTVPVVIGEGWGYDPRAMLQRLEVAQRAGPLYMDDFFGHRVEGTVSVDNETVVPEADGNGYTIRADLTILYTRQTARVDAGALLDCGFVVA